MPAAQASDGADRAGERSRVGSSARTKRPPLPSQADYSTPQPGTTRSVLPGMTLCGIQPCLISGGLA